MRALALALLTTGLLLAGCSGSAPRDAGDDIGTASLDAMDEAAAAPPKPVKMEAVQDDVSFSGTVAASVCWFDGSQVSCANVGGSNVLVYLHDRKGELAGGELKVSFSPAAGSGPHARAYIAEDCEEACRLVQELADNGPSLDSPPVGTGGTYDLSLPAATILANQTLVVRITPILLTSLASASPVYDVQLEGTLDFQVPT